MLRQAVETRYVEAEATNLSRKEIIEGHFRDIKQWEMLGMLLVTAGGGLGLLMFGSSRNASAGAGRFCSTTWLAWWRRWWSSKRCRK